MSIPPVMPSSLILWYPLLLLPSIFHIIKNFSNESAVHIRWPKYWSFNLSISPSNEYSGLISLKTDWFDLRSPRDSQESSPAPQFKGINSLTFFLLYSPALTTIHDQWEDCSLDYTDLCQQNTVSAFQNTVSVQFSLSRDRLFVTPWTAACQASLSITNSWGLLKLMSIESFMPSNHLILCHPPLLPSSIFPSTRVFSSESVLCIRWPKYWSFSISPSNEYSGLISFRMDWLDLLAVQGTLKSLLCLGLSWLSCQEAIIFWFHDCSHHLQWF